MKFSISVFHIRKAISLVRDVVPPRSITREGSGILIESGDNAVVFSAVGTDTVLRVSMPAHDVEEGRACVNSSLFSAVVNTFQPLDEEKKLGTDKLVIGTDFHNGVITISAKSFYRNGKVVRHKRKVPLLNAELFPSLPQYKQQSAVVFPASLFKEAIDKTYYATSSSEDYSVMGGIYMKASGGTFCSVATNGLKLAEFTSKVSPDLEFEAIVPTKFAIKVSKAIDPKEDLLIVPTENIFWVSAESLLVGGFLFMGEYPDYKSFLPEHIHQACVDKGVFIENIRNLDFGELDNNRVTLAFNNKKLHISTELAENDFIETDFEGDFVVSFDIKQLKSSIQRIDGDSLEIEFSGNLRPVYFCSPDSYEEESMRFTTVIVPLNI